MKLYAARYFFDMPDKIYEIVLYERKKMAEENPHDYLLSFSKSGHQRFTE